MGADNFLGGGFDSDSARYERQNRLNPPDFAPGQGDDDLFKSDFEQPVSGGSGMNDIFSSSGGDIFGGGNTGMPGSFNSSMFNQPNPMQGQGQGQSMSDEDKFFDAIAKGGKGLVGFFNDIVSSSKGLSLIHI